MKVRIGLGFGPWPFPERKANVFYDLIALCDRIGIDSVWFSDRIVGGDLLEPSVAMAAVAGRSNFMKLGTNALIFPLRNPVVMAKELATVDFLSNGRLLLVVGLGRDDNSEFEACGVEKKSRGKRTDDMIVALRRLWIEDAVSFEGETFRFRDVTISPKPVQKPCPPIWIGGNSDAAMQRTARLGDGWLPSYITPKEAARGVAAIKQYASEIGRQIPDDHYGVNIHFAIAPSLEEALELSEPYRTARRKDLAPEAFGAYGTSQEIVERLREYVAGGITKFVLRPVCPPDQWFWQLERLASDVLKPLQTPFSEREVKERAGELAP